MKTKDLYKLVKATKGQTDKGSNYFDLEVLNLINGEIINCTYFGNTTPKRVTKIEEQISKDGEKRYLIASIQPHTCRDKKTGRFISAYRA